MKKILVFLLLLPIVSQAQALSGTYTIGAGQTYTTLTAAINALNTNGVSADVTFLISANQTTTVPYTINQFAGSATYTTTFKPASGADITIQTNNVDANTTCAATFLLNGADRVVFDGNNGTADNKLTIFRNNTKSNDNTAVVHFYNGAAYNTFRNLIVKNNTATGNTLPYGFVAGGTTIGSTGNNPNNTIDNVTFNAVLFPVNIYGVSAASNANWIVKNSTVASGARSGFYVSNANNAYIFGNTFTSLSASASTDMYAISLTGSNSAYVAANTVSSMTNSSSNNTSYGIYVSGSDAVLYGNTVGNMTTQQTHLYGIYSTGANATITMNKVTALTGSGSDKNGIGIYSDGNNNVVANNMVANIKGATANTSGSYGIYVNSGSGVRVLFNSVLQQTTQSNAKIACLYINAGSSLDVRDNLLINNTTTSGAARYAIYSVVAKTAYTNIDYNDYYAPSGQYVGYLGSNQSTIANWRTATGSDTNSINYNPTFTSTTDLHLNATNASNISSLDNQGVAIDGFPLDIDNETRNGATPDMGADEWGAKCSGSTITYDTYNVFGYIFSIWSNVSGPTANDKAILNANYNTASGNITACELTVSAGKTLTVAAGDIVTVYNNITVNGTLSIEDTGSLVQVDDAATQTGNITIKKKTTPLKQYDFTYWSAPVAGTTLSVLVNGGGSQYYYFNAATNAWTAATAATTMAKGTGYIARAPSNLSYATPQTVEATFTGVPYTGIVTVPVYKTASNAYNLIGNPYPSALSADTFIKANSAYTGTLNKNITGTLYFWTHKTAVSTSNTGDQVYNYASDDYSKYNLSGGVQSGSGGAVPTGNIAVGQGFFLETTGSGNVTFNNSMRIKASGSNSQFFRTAAPMAVAADSTATAVTDEFVQKNRVWVSLSNEQGAFAQTLLAYITGATDGLDYGYDGATIDGGNYIMLYSILDNTKLCIQGRNVNFQNTDVIPLGFKTSITGDFKIRLDQMDGLFSGNQNVYLVDKLTNTTVNLKDGAYTFNVAEAGTFDERFELRFTNETLGTGDPVVVDNKIDFITRDHGIEIMATTQNIAGLQLFDMLGRQVYSKEGINTNTFSTGALNVRNQVVIAKLRTENGAVVTRKIILN